MRPKVPRFLRHDLLRKLTALFFALVIWLAVSAQLRQTVEVPNVTVTLNYDPTETIIESGIPTVNLKVWGTPRALEQLRSSDIQLNARVPEVAPGTHFCTIGISKRNVVRTPPGIRVVSVDQERIQVRLDRFVTREDVPVTVRFEGSVHEGYRRTRRKVTPDTVVLRGPYRLVKDIREVTTETVMLDDTMVQDFSVEVPLSRIVGVTMPKSVRVEVWVALASGRRNYPNLPLGVLMPPVHRFQVAGELPRISLGVQGSETALDKLTEDRIRAFVDLSTIKAPGQHLCPVRVWLDGDSGLLVQSPNPANVTVKLTPIAAAIPPPAETGKDQPPANVPQTTPKQPPAQPTPQPAEAAPPQPKPKPDAAN